MIHGKVPPPCIIRQKQRNMLLCSAAVLIPTSVYTSTKIENSKGHDGKTTQTIIILKNEDGHTEDPTSNSHLPSLHEKEFRGDIWKLFKKFKEYMERNDPQIRLKIM